jgi:hypothetical protein
MSEQDPFSVNGSRPGCLTCRRRQAKGCDNGVPECKSHMYEYWKAAVTVMLNSSTVRQQLH